MTMNRREVLAGAAGAVAVAAMPAEGLEQRAYREFIAEIKPRTQSDDQSAREFARESMRPNGSLIRRARLAAPMSPGQVATQAGLTGALRVLNLENGEGDEASFSEGMELCRVLSIDVSTLADECLGRRLA